MKEDLLLPLIPYLAIVWKGRYRLMAIAVLFLGVGALRYAFGPKSYEAAATLLVAPPPFRNTDDEEIAAMMAKTLKVEDYKRIVESPGVLRIAIDKVRGLDEWPEEKIRRFAKPSVLTRLMTAETEIIEKTPQNVVYSVVINLAAKADSPEAAAALAEAWAEASVEVVKKSSSGTTEVSRDFLEGEYNSVTEDLTGTEDELDATRDKYETQLTDFNNETVIALNAIEDEMDLVIGEFDDRTRELLQQHQNQTDEKVKELENESEQMLSEYENATEEALSAFDQETEHMLLKLKDEREKKLRQLEAELGIELAQQRVGVVASEVLESDRKLMYVRKAMSDNEAEYKAVIEELKKHPEFKTLSKAITDDALWQKLSLDGTTGGLPAQLDGVKLRDEEPNPVYDELIVRLARTRVNFGKMPIEEAYLLKQIEQKEKEYQEAIKVAKDKEFRLSQVKRELEVEWINLERERLGKQQQLEREREAGLENLKRERETMLENLKRQGETEYATLERQREATVQSLSRGWLAKLSKREDERATEAMILQREGELEADRLERQVLQQKATYEVLASRYLSAQLATADKTADIVIVGDVVPPDRPVGFARTLVLPASLVVGLIVGLAYVFVADMWRKVRALILNHVQNAEDAAEA